MKSKLPGLLLEQIRHRLFRKLSLQSKTNLRNSFWGGVDYLVSAASVFLLIPVLLATIGQEMFGIMVIVNTIMGFTGLVSFGLGQATLKYVSEFRATGETDLIGEVIRSTLFIYAAMGLIACLVAFFFAEGLAAKIFSVNPDQLREATIAIQLGGLGFLAFLLSGVGENAWKGFERFDVPVIVRSTARVLTLVGQVVLALSGFGIAWLVGLQVGLTLIGAIVILLLLKIKLVPDLTSSFLPSMQVIRRVFSYGVYTYVSGLFGMLRHSGDTLIVGFLLGPSAVALYVIPIRVLSQIHGLLARAFGYLFPYVGKLHALKENQELENCYHKSTLWLSVISAAIITPLGLFAYPLLKLWLGADIAVQSALIMQIMALRFAIYPLSIINGYFLMATGHVRAMMVIVAFNCILALTMIAVGAYYAGLVGAALAQLVVIIQVLINRAFIEKKLFGSVNLCSASITPLIVICPLMLFFYFGFYSDVAGLISILFWGAVTGLMSAALVAGLLLAIQLLSVPRQSNRVAF